MKNIFYPVGLAWLGLAFCSAPVLASTDDNWYVGVGAGEVSSDTKEDSTVEKNDESDVGYKIFAGYNFSKYLAIELSHLNGGRLTSNDFDKDVLTVDFTTTSLGVVGSYPVNRYFVPFVKAGLHSWKLEGRDYRASTGITSTGNVDGTSYFMGVGVAIPISKSFQVNAEYEMYDVDVDSSNNAYSEYKVMSLSAVYTF